MARRKLYNINRFDGGMTNNTRDTSDLSKCAYVSHFDIYRDSNQMYVMPGFVDDMSLADDADAMKTYDLRAISYLDGYVAAVGTKADGTGSKIFYKEDATDTNWIASQPFASGASVEGTDNVASYTFLASEELGDWFFVTTATTLSYVSYNQGATITDKYATIGATSGDTDFQPVAEEYYDGIVYTTKGNGFSGVSKIDGSVYTVTQKTTAFSVRDIQTGSDQLGILVNQTSPAGAKLLLWDSASLLIDQNIEMGDGRPVALGYPSGQWTAVLNEGVGTADTTLSSETNGISAMVVKRAFSTGGEVVYRMYAATPTNGIILPTRSTYRNAMLWYARLGRDSTPTAYYEGLWAYGRGTVESPLGISVLLDTGTLGEVQYAVSFGSHFYFIHGGDGSISRLDDLEDGTFDVSANYESLIFGAESPYQKELEGVSVVTENLPSGASVACYYRTDLDDSWTLMGTSDTDGQKKHNFTRKSDATPIGKFQEIQFKMVVTGKVTVKNILISVTETDDLPFSS